MNISNISQLKRLMHCGIVLTLLTAVTSCQENTLATLDIEEAESVITFRCADMLDVYKGSYNPASRAADPKDEFEKQIKTLHVFFFNQETGELLTSTDGEAFPAYMKLTDGFLKIPTLSSGESLFEEDAGVKVHIVAIANIDATDEAADASESSNSFKTAYSPDGKIAKASREKGADINEIKTYADLQEWVYYPRLRIDESTGLGDIRNLPAAGMPMIGELKDVYLNTKPATPYIVNMKALMAKIRVTVKLDPDQFDENLPELQIEEIGVMNMPVAVPFLQPSGEKPATRPTDYDDYLTNCNVTKVSMVHPGTDRDDDKECEPELHEYTSTLSTPIVITRHTDPAVLTYYTYENIQLPDYNAKRTNNTDAFDENLEPQYPDGITDADKQRWKSTLAYKNRASALILKGKFTTHQEVDYQAKFTVFMGGNENDDFKVIRNRCYDNNITIYGLDYIRNSDDGVYNFDGRVNVVSDNPLYLAVVNERKIDAHATALPVDVWLMMWEEANNSTEGDPNVNWRSEVSLSIQDPGNHAWIRMGNIITREEMERGGWKAGTGAEEYFTTDLVTKTLASGTERTITSDEHGSRSRVYFYIDENVPDSNDPTNYGDRKATVDVVYKRFSQSTGELVEERNYTLDIEQRALLKVSGTHSGSGETVPDTWMEYYEEYLEHNDPLDKHEMPGEYYTGLRWWKTTGTNLSNANSVDIKDITTIPYKDYAYAMTWYAVGVNNKTADINTIKLFNTDEPESTFHYCLGKNKRNKDGSVPEPGDKNNNKITPTTNSAGWYMPGIRELEHALVMYYDVFPGMRDKFYWSACGGPGDTSDSYARATRVTIGPDNQPVYTTSAASGDPGYQNRTEYNRVRAFYRVEE